MSMKPAKMYVIIPKKKKILRDLNVGESCSKICKNNFNNLKWYLKGEFLMPDLKTKWIVSN